MKACEAPNEALESCGCILVALDVDWDVEDAKTEAIKLDSSRKNTLAETGTTKTTKTERGVPTGW